MCETVTEKTSELQNLLSEYKAAKSDYQPVDRTQMVNDEWQSYKTKSDQLSCKLDILSIDLRKYARKTEVLDHKSRKNNVIVEMLFEHDNEDTTKLVNEILTHSLSKENRELIRVKKAY